MTNKLLILAFLFTALTTVNLSAQKLGIRAEYGAQSLSQESTYLISANRSIDYRIGTKSVTPSRSIGLYTKFDYGWLFFQPEFLYTTYDQTLEIESFSEEARGIGVTEVTENFQQFDIPLYAGIQYKFIKVGAGPVFHVGQNIDSDIADFDNLEVRTTPISAGFQTGLGIDFKYFSLDLKYQRDFNQATDHIYFTDGNEALSNKLSSFRVGVAFALGKNK